MMKNNTIEFADGTVLDGRAGYDGIDLTLRFAKDIAFAHLQDFLDPGKMKTIAYYYGAYKNVFRGFTRFEGITPRPSDSDIMLVHMRGSETSVEEKIPTVPEEYLS
jgi:hypothetical protein